MSSPISLPLLSSMLTGSTRGQGTAQAKPGASAGPLEMVVTESENGRVAARGAGRTLLLELPRHLDVGQRITIEIAGDGATARGARASILSIDGQTLAQGEDAVVLDPDEIDILPRRQAPAVAARLIVDGRVLAGQTVAVRLTPAEPPINPATKNAMAPTAPPPAALPGEPLAGRAAQPAAPLSSRAAFPQPLAAGPAPASAGGTAPPGQPPGAAAPAARAMGSELARQVRLGPHPSTSMAGAAIGSEPLVAAIAKGDGAGPHAALLRVAGRQVDGRLLLLSGSSGLVLDDPSIHLPGGAVVRVEPLDPEDGRLETLPQLNEDPSETMEAAALLGAIQGGRARSPQRHAAPNGKLAHHLLESYLNMLGIGADRGDETASRTAPTHSRAMPTGEPDRQPEPLSIKLPGDAAPMLATLIAGPDAATRDLRQRDGGQDDASDQIADPAGDHLRINLALSHLGETVIDLSIDDGCMRFRVASQAPIADDIRASIASYVASVVEVAGFSGRITFSRRLPSAPTADGTSPSRPDKA